jgi:hypothetical protein
MRLAAMGSGANPPVRLQQSQIIGHVHLHHLGVNQTRAREQTNFRRILDHMII